MYASFFGLKDKPFNMTPDPRYLFLSASHEEALSGLLYGIQEKKGLMTLTGPVGVGKTTILFSFLERIKTRTETLLFPGGIAGSRADFFRELCKRFQVSSDHDSLFDLTREMENHLEERARVGKNVVLLVDEAQDLGVEELTHFRYLNNLETTQAKFLQIVLSGTETLEDTLRGEKLLSLRQRVAIHCRLAPLDPKSAVDYILHRLHVAGCPLEQDLFEPEALWRIVHSARGIPRLINVICDNAMIIAFALKEARIRESFVQEALESIGEKGGFNGSRAIVSLEEVRGFLQAARVDEGRTPCAQGPASRDQERDLRETRELQRAPVQRGASEANREVRNEDGPGGGSDGPGDVERGEGSASRPVGAQTGEPAKTRKWRPVYAGVLLLIGFTLGAVLILLVSGKGEKEGRVSQTATESRSPEARTIERPQEDALREGVGGAPVEEEPDRVEGRTYVSTGEGLGSIVLANFGSLNWEIFQALSEKNPSVSDWNRLDSGGELLLPDVPASSDRLSDFHTVQVASFLSKEKTERIAADLCKSEIQNVFVITQRADPVTGDRWNCVCAGIFPGAEDAAERVVDMRQRGFPDAFATRLRGARLADVLFPCVAH